MTIEFKPGRYFVGMWHAEYSGGNMLAAIYSDDDETWELIYRFRDFVDDKYGPASADVLRWKRVTTKGKAGLIASAHTMFTEVPTRMGFVNSYQPIEEDGHEWFERREKLGLLPDFFSVIKTVEVAASEDEINWEEGWIDQKKRV